MSDFQKRIRELEEEISYLHSILDSHGISYSDCAVRTDICVDSSDNDESNAIDTSNSVKMPEQDQGSRILQRNITPAMASFFYSYFKGRSDVYSKRANLKNGGAGYFPVCNNFWHYGVCPKADGKKLKCLECSNRDYKKLTILSIMEHLKGDKTDGSDVIGLYPLLMDDTCNFLAFDFDDHDERDNQQTNGKKKEANNDWHDEVNAVRQICINNGIDVLTERSRSGCGAHIWIFFDKPVSADKARRFGSALLTKGSESVNLKNFSFYDRMIPMQDHLQEGMLGNLVALPLQGQALKHGNSAFVDENWDTIPDQWQALCDKKRISERIIDKKINEWTADDNVLGTLSGDMSNDEAVQQEKPWEKTVIQFHREDVSGNVNIVFADSVYIEKSNLRPRLQNQLRRMAAYSNPEFYKKLAMGYSTYDTPRIMYCGFDTGNYISIPRGCCEKVTVAFDSAQIPYCVTDKRQVGKKIKVEFNGKLYPEQQTAADNMLKYDIGVLGAATAFGKTVVAAYLISRKKVNTLILVDNSEILKVWLDDLQKFLVISEKMPEYKTPTGRIKKRSSIIGSLKAGHDSMTGIVDVAMIQSLGAKDDVNPAVKEYGLVIMDECHHAGAETDEEVLRQISAKTVYGLTATPKREDGQDKKIFMQLGPIRYRYTAKDRAAKQGIQHFIFPRFIRLADLTGNKLSVTDANRMLVDSEIRNEQLIGDALNCVAIGRTPILMTKYKEHAEYLYEHLHDKADYVFLLEGGRGSREKNEVRDAMRNVNENESLIIIAIGKYVGEGFDFPRLDTLILAMPISWQGNVEQYAGRINRDYKGKKNVVIFDYIDSHIPVFERMYQKRLRTYKRIGYEICSQLDGTMTEISDSDNYDEINNSIFDSETYHEIYEKDVISAKKEIIISSPGLSGKKVIQFTTMLKKIMEKGVRVVVMTKNSDEYPLDAVQRARENINLLRNVGVIVRCPNECHEHFAVIDSKICWYGSMNLISNEKDDDSLMRILSREIAEELKEVATKDK